MLLFLTNLDKSKSFPLQIANRSVAVKTFLLNIKFILNLFDSYCEDDRYQKLDKDCWTGEHFGDYTHKVMDMHSQKYNPEVPTLQTNNNDRLHQLNDQLITLKNMVNKQVRESFVNIWLRSAFNVDDNQVSFLWQMRPINFNLAQQNKANDVFFPQFSPYLDDSFVKIG